MGKLFTLEKLFKHPWAVVGIITVITVFFAIQLPKTEFDNNQSNFLPDKNPVKVTATYLEDLYGDATVILVALERPYGTIFDRDFLQKIRDFESALETVGNL